LYPQDCKFTVVDEYKYNPCNTINNREKKEKLKLRIKAEVHLQMKEHRHSG
jgi:hypothetical protein